MASVGEQLVDLAQVVATGLAAVGLLLAYRQLRLQHKDALLSRLAEVDRLWSQHRARSTDQRSALSEQTMTLTRGMYAGYGLWWAARESAMGALDRPTPYFMAPLLPLVDPSCSGAPSAEHAYAERRDAQAWLLAMLFDGLEASADAEVKADLEHLAGVVKTMVDDMNGMAERYEFGLIDRRAFLGKYHGAIIQLAAMTEPIHLAMLIRQPDGPRYGMRLFSLGACARAFHWGRSIQEGPVLYDGFRPQLGAAITKGHIGWLAERYRSIRLKSSIRTPFAIGSKKRQNSWLRGLRREWIDPRTREQRTAGALNVLHAMTAPGMDER